MAGREDHQGSFRGKFRVMDLFWILNVVVISQLSAFVKVTEPYREEGEF